MASQKSRVLHRSLRETPPRAVGGEGVWLIAEDGKRILDASGGAAVSCLGHQHPRVLEAMSRQASKLAYAHTGFFSSEPAEALAEHLVGDEPGGLAYAYFVSGGSEAIEAGIKLARQYFLETRRAAAHALHRPAPELSRQYAGRARRRRQRLAARALCAAAVGRVQPCDAGLRLPRKARRRIRGGVRGAARGRAGGRIPAARPRHGRGLHRRAGGRRDGGLRDGAGGIFPRRARDLRPSRRAAHPRRGDVRHGPHRHAARLGAGGDRARHPGRRQGTRRRLSADRRHARERRRSSMPSGDGLRRIPARPYLSGASDGLRRRARRAAGHPRGAICSTGSRIAARISNGG